MTSSNQAALDPRFPWNRYWRVLSGEKAQTGASIPEESSEDSFLYLPANMPPELEIMTSLRTLPDLFATQALILLGRPGSGKSTELEIAKQSGLLEKDGCKLVYQQAKAFEGNARDLIAEVDHARSNGNAVRLVLDGADELLIGKARFLNSLEAELQSRVRQTDVPALKLIISCRAAEWPEGKLANIWPQDQITIARLCQLHSEAANDYVKKHLGDQTDAFWREVTKLKIGFLAVWPHSLSGLVGEFRDNNGRLPGTLFDLVERTARRRCDIHHSETDPERRRRLRDQNIEPEWLYRLASRAAALGIFSGKPLLAQNPGDSGAGVISSQEFAAEAEPWLDATTRLVTQNDLDALQRTALFDPAPKGRLVFSHQLMREFLAAAWLADRKVTVPQLEMLFGSHREDGAWRHYPQLAPIAAWLASHPLQRPWRTFLIEHDPAVLLRADAASLVASEKKDIVSALLKCAVRDRAVDSGWQHRHLRSLACDGLAEILRPYLLNFSGDHEAARDLAIDITREAVVKDAAPALWEAIRKPPVKLRPSMAYALLEVAGDSYDSEWMEILDGAIPLDDQGALLGAALKALVPRRLKVRDVLRHLIPQRDFRIIGLYTRVHGTMTDHMEKADALPIVRHSSLHHASGFGE